MIKCRNINGIQLDLAVELSAEFGDFRGLSMQITHAMDKEIVQTNIICVAQTQRGSLDLIGNFKCSSRNTEALIELKENNRIFSVAFSNEVHLKRNTILSVHSELFVEYSDVQIQLIQDVVIDTDSVSQVLSFSSPYRDIENITYVGHFKQLPDIGSSSYEASLNFGPNGNLKKCEAEVTVDKHSANVRIVTPFTPLSHFHVVTVAAKEGMDFQCSVEGQITVSHKAYYFGGNLVRDSYPELDVSGRIYLRGDRLTLREIINKF